MSIRVSTRIDILEINGKETLVKRKTMVVENHQYSDRVVLLVGESRYTVHASALQTGIANATRG